MPLVLSVFFWLFCLGIYVTPGPVSAQTAPVADQVHYLDQGWSQEERLKYYYTSQGSAVMPPVPSGPWQLSDLARMRETVVLPTPRVPVNK